MRRLKAFTLIELLVVIAIIAILAAILFPVFARARDRAKMSACISNEKQIGIALTTYADDWQECYPPERVLSPGWTLGSPTWKDALDPYIKSKDVWICPGNDQAWSPAPAPYGTGKKGDECGRFPRSYAYNGDIFYQNPTNQHKAVPISKFKSPGGTILFVETRSTYSDLPSDGGSTWWAQTGAIRTTIVNPKSTKGAFNAHSSGMINFIFADTHVQSLKLRQTFVPTPMWPVEPGKESNPQGTKYADLAKDANMLPEYR